MTGGVSTDELEDNVRPWSGDHNFNPPDVPGMLFCNRRIAAASPGICDIGPTVLDLFGVPVPPHCDGASLLPATPAREAPAPAAAPAAAAGRAEAAREATPCGPQRKENSRPPRPAQAESGL